MKQKLLMDVLHPKAAGIDVGSRSHFVAVGQGINQVREFGIYTVDHKELIAWLKEEKMYALIEKWFFFTFGG